MATTKHCTLACNFASGAAYYGRLGNPNNERGSWTGLGEFDREAAIAAAMVGPQAHLGILPEPDNTAAQNPVFSTAWGTHHPGEFF